MKFEEFVEKYAKADDDIRCRVCQILKDCQLRPESEGEHEDICHTDPASFPNQKD